MKHKQSITYRATIYGNTRDNILAQITVDATTLGIAATRIQRTMSEIAGALNADVYEQPSNTLVLRISLGVISKGAP